MISSPCTKNCKLDESKTKCLGCGRNIEDIKYWKEYSEERRVKIMKGFKNGN